MPTRCRVSPATARRVREHPGPNSVSGGLPMALSADLYVPGRSWAHRLDPRVKLLFVACFIVLVLVYDNLFFMLAALLLMHLLHFSARVPAARLFFIWRTLWPVALLMALLWTLFYPRGEPVAAFWIVEITVHALAQGAALGLRILVMAFAVFAWLYTTDQAALVRSLVKVGMPYEWGLVLALALRYIPTFQGSYVLISEAQAARGLELRGAGFARVRRMMPIFVAMIVTSLRASEQLARAIEARALGAPGARRSVLHDIRFRAADYAACGLLVALTAALLYLNFSLGIGEHPIALG